MEKRKLLYKNLKAGKAGQFVIAIAAIFFWAVVFFDMPRQIVFSLTADSLKKIGFSKIPNAIKNLTPERLMAERDELLAKVKLLETRIRETEATKNFSEENLGAGKTAIIQSIPPQSPYDIILIASGEQNGIRKGEKVIKNGIFLGIVEEVSPGSAKVKLLSYPKLQTEAFLESPALNITLEGYGGLNMVFLSPKDLGIKLGDKIISNTSPVYLIGEVGYIKSKESDPLQTIYISPPLNLRHLRSVEIVP